MNEKFEYIPVLESQLAIDYDCTAEEVHCQDNIFRVMKRNEDARPIGSENTMLKIAVYREKLLVMAEECLLEWCKKRRNHESLWNSKTGNRKIDFKAICKCRCCRHVQKLSV